MDTLKSFSEAFCQLSNLEGFDPKAFVANDKDEQIICNFILSLSLIYNDIKNVDLSIDVLKSSKPEGKFQARQDWGEYNGISMFFTRLQISILNELMDNICDLEQKIQHPLFLKIVEKISKKSRKAWGLLVKAANTTSTLQKTKNPYYMIRNKASFHYDINQIYKGYVNFFEKRKPDMLPMISRGNQMVKSRFYFADAAAETCLHLPLDGMSLDSFLSELNSNLANLNQAIQDIVKSFITIRKPGWKQI